MQHLDEAAEVATLLAYTTPASIERGAGVLRVVEVTIAHPAVQVPTTVTNVSDGLVALRFADAAIGVEGGWFGGIAAAAGGC